MSNEGRHVLSRSAGFGRRLRSLREHRGLTETMLASRLGVSRVAAEQWEREVTQPTLGMVERIAELLQVEPEYLAFGAGESGRQAWIGWQQTESS